MHKGYLLLDFSNIGFVAAAGPVLSVGEQQTQAIYGFLRMLRPMIAMYPMLKPVVLGDGRSWRYDFFPEYKASRKKEAQTKNELKMAELKKSLVSQQPIIREALALLGVPYLVAQNLEADDLAGIMIQRYTPSGQKVLMISGDKDWIQLIGPGVGWRDPRADAKIKAVNSGTLKELLGVDTPQQWLEVKAVMGDKSDELPGVGGIGDKGAVELLNTYGSVTSFINGTIDGTIDVKTLPKKFRDFAQDEDKLAIFKFNMDMMDLRSPKIPAAIDMRLTKGKLDKEGFEAFCRKWHFKSIFNDIADWLEPFERIAA